MNIESQDYLKHGLNIIKINGMKNVTRNMDWNKIFERVNKITLMNDARNYLLKILKKYNIHSDIIFKNEQKFLKKVKNEMPQVSYKNNTLTIVIPSFIAECVPLTNERKIEEKEYVKTVKNGILYFFKRYKINGLIIDVRNNYGGYIFPIITSLQYIIGTGSMFCLTKDNINCEKYLNLVKNGMRVSRNKIPIKNRYGWQKCVPVAALISSKTASCGELIVISLKSFCNLKIFGQKSKGFISINRAYNLLNGDIMLLTDKNILDPNGVLHKHIIPDIITDSANREARLWIKKKLKNNIFT